MIEGPVTTPPLLSPTHSASPVPLAIPEGAIPEHDPYGLIDASHLDERYRPPSPTELATTFRHSFWQTARERARRAMVDADYPLARRFSFQCCGANPLVQIDPVTDEVRIKARCCHDRWCRACGRTKRLRLSKALAEICAARKTLAVVLTPKHNDKPLGEQLTDLLANFAKLRRHPFWQQNVTGGAWVVEVTYNQKHRQWHPHLHVFVHSCWLEQADLSATWLEVTGNSYIVDVSLVENVGRAVRELTKYVGKITHRSWEHEHDLLVHAMRELNGRRLCNTFGSLKGTELQPTSEEVDARHWLCWGSIDQLFRMKDAGDRQALAIHKALVTGHPIDDPDLAWEICTHAHLGILPGDDPPHLLEPAACGA